MSLDRGDLSEPQITRNILLKTTPPSSYHHNFYMVKILHLNNQEISQPLELSECSCTKAGYCLPYCFLSQQLHAVLRRLIHRSLKLLQKYGNRSCDAAKLYQSLKDLRVLGCRFCCCCGCWCWSTSVDEGPCLCCICLRNLGGTSLGYFCCCC